MPPTAAADWTIAVGSERTSAVFEPATSEQRAIFVCAHGAGGHKDDRGMLNTARALRSVGLGVVRYNFLYREKKSGRPDPMPRLKECVVAVVEYAKRELGEVPVIIGGRSMGGRASSMLAADGYDAAGLFLLAYPLHPAGKPEQLRDAHLPAIRMPVLCINGTRDPLCKPDLMEKAVRRVPTRWTMHWVEGADHSFHVLKSSGRNDADVLTEIATVARRWLDETL